MFIYYTIVLQQKELEVDQEGGGGGGGRGVAIQTKSSCILYVYWVQLTAVVMKSKQ